RSLLRPKAILQLHSHSRGTTTTISVILESNFKYKWEAQVNFYIQRPADPILQLDIETASLYLQEEKIRDERMQLQPHIAALLQDFPDELISRTYVIISNGIKVQTENSPSTIVVKKLSNPNTNQHKKTPPKFHVSFNDHIDNDFNTLFKPFPPSGNYYAAGVPGSFHVRLFPKATLHFVHSSYSLHWLSKFPEEVKDRNFPAWNTGRIYFAGDCNGQFKREVNNFLNARAQEIVKGGLMCIIINVLPNGIKICETSGGFLQDLSGDCLKDLANKGLVSEKEVDSFNVPVYNPTIGKVEDIIEHNNQFSILSISKLKYSMPKTLPTDQIVTGQIRDAMESVIRENFREKIVEEWFELFLKKLPETRQLRSNEKYHKNINLCILLKCKSD
ncbi:SAM dependent carboxyl methyltransferase, partial [Dillenia turbinata]